MSSLDLSGLAVHDLEVVTADMSTQDGGMTEVGYFSGCGENCECEYAPPAGN